MEHHVTMGGGRPIKVAAMPPTEAAGSPDLHPTLTLAEPLTIEMCRGFGKDHGRWTAPVAGVYSMATWPPTLIEEKTMTDPIDTAEHFSQEAVDYAVRVAKTAKMRMRVEELERIRNRFRYHPPTHPAVVEAHERARTLGEMFSIWLIDLPDCPEKEAALHAVDAAAMWANAAIARTQLGIPTEQAPEVDAPAQ